MILTADECEPFAEFKDQKPQMLDQSTLEITLQHFRT
jgi:hypothetical protein